MRAYCVQCGIDESVKSDLEVKKQYSDMDVYLKFSRKKRFAVKGDGHCLPRAVFRGAKYLNLNYITYSALLKAAADGIKSDFLKYTGIITDTEVSAKKALDTYIVGKIYTLGSNIIDVIVVAFANQTSCVIKIYYQGLDGSFDTHHITPDAPSRGVIGLAFMNAHYDLITNIAKQEGVTQTPNVLATSQPQKPLWYLSSIML